MALFLVMPFAFIFWLLGMNKIYFILWLLIMIYTEILEVNDKLPKR